MTTVTADLELFVVQHREHGALAPQAGAITPNGYRLEVSCPCGVTGERWVAPIDAVEDLLRQYARLKLN